MNSQELPRVQPGMGLGVLHLFGKVTEQFRPQAMVEAVRQAQAEATIQADLVVPGGTRTDSDYNMPSTQVVTLEILGHKADIGFMILGFDFWRLRQLQTSLGRAGLEWASSYLSVTEISEYAAGVPEEMQLARLYPKLPPDDKAAWCFYPMSKRRGEANNWFRLPFDERKELMHEHGASGRQFSGRVLQVITGSTGLDDFEWGVTLFCQDPQDLKEVVYTLRFDEGSALYGEFGAFWTGMVAEPEVIAARFGSV